MSDAGENEASDRAPVSGTCARCGCSLGFLASRREDIWYCCGGCAGSNRCTCGCKPELETARSSDSYVPTRRMFGARRADGLNTPSGYRDRNRAFPFADPKRGR